MNENLTVTDYLDSILLDTDEDTDYVFCVQTSPIGEKSIPWAPVSEGEVIAKVRRMKDRPYSAYISTMIAKKDEMTGRYRNRQQDFYALAMVVLDDVGDKVQPNDLQPTFKIETSENNYQWGYVFKEPVTDVTLAGQIIRAVYETDLTDNGGKMTNKFVRLPFGVNNKLRDGVVNEFRVRLVENTGNFYTPEQLMVGFGIELAPKIPEREMVLEVQDNGMPAEDSVLTWLGANGYVIDDNGGDWIDILCPWHHGHTSGTSVAGYAPLGRGNRPEFRGFNCMHEHCSDYKTKDFLEWTVEHGAAAVYNPDPVSMMVSRYCFLEFSNEVADTRASAGSKYPLVSLTSFKNANRQYVTGSRGGKQYHHDLWQEHREMVKTKGRTYNPGEKTIMMIDGVPHFNTYRAPHHMSITGLPTEYLEHIEWLIPEAEQREVFHDWIAKKLQEPRSRSYAMVMVSDLLEGEEGYAYGTGRSTVGDILGRVFQAGIAKISLEDVTGKGDSQTAYNDWIDSTQLAIVEETKDTSDSWRNDYASYERVKQMVDTRPIPGARVKPKYGRIFETTIYANFLFYTNHSNALQLPEGDRRFYVIENNKGKRSYEEYARLQEFLHSDREIAKLFHWYMKRNVSQYDHINPPMTKAKERMIRQSVSEVGEIWNRMVASFPKGIVTLKMLMDRSLLFVEPGDELAKTVVKMIRAKWRKLAEIEHGYKLKVEGRDEYPRLIKNNKKILQDWEKGGNDYVRMMLLANREMSQ